MDGATVFHGSSRARCRCGEAGGHVAARGGGALCALFDLAIDSKLRGCDLVKIRIRDLVAGSEIRTRAIVVQQNTGRPVQFEITSDVRSSLLAWLD